MDGLANLDPFYDTDPQAMSVSLKKVDDNDLETERRMYISPIVDGTKEDLEYEDVDGKIFNEFNEE